MRINIDKYKEIIEAISRNKSRSFLTGFGVFWGIFMLMLLVGGSAGLKEILEQNFEGFAQNTCLVFANNTTKPYKGFKQGRSWNMNYTDVDRIKNQVPETDVVTPLLSGWGKTANFGVFSQSCTMKGVRPDYQNIEAPTLAYGRFINGSDVNQGRKVCVIGKKIYKTLFPGGGDPCGKFIQVDSIYFQVVGVDYANGNISVNGRAEECVTIPISVYQKIYNTGEIIELLCFTGKEGVTLSDITPHVREVISRAHYIDPEDEPAMAMINTQLMFGIMNNLFKGVNFLVWLIGIGTILAGAIGVSNIMMVAVKERTTEIGIRRAIGATPKMILSQIIDESIILTLFSGLAGIVVAVFILNMVELGMTTDGILKAHFQVGFSTAIIAALMLTVLGVLAGLAPAMRAMSIKPVDAMRDE
jgi:putative ABC transport system permease protein